MPAPKDIYYNKQLYESEAHKIHGDKYDYSQTIPDGSTRKIEVICKHCGESFNVGAWDHLYSRGHGRGCPKCANKMRSKTLTKDTQWFMDKLKLRRGDHGDYYDYSNVVYRKSTDEIEIGCPIHGVFKQSAWSHLNGSGCPICAQEKIANSNRYSWDEFFEIMKNSRSDNCDFYDYSKVRYTDTHTEIEICCPIHGPFFQTPNQHKRNGKCPRCAYSSLEIAVAGWLDANGVRYKKEKTFKWLGQMRLDFFLPDYNIAIECNGIQHYKPIRWFNRRCSFEVIKARDYKKRYLCNNHGIRLYTIRYDEKNIGNHLKKILQKQTK